MKYFTGFGTFAKYIDTLAVLATPRLLAGVNEIGHALYKSVYDNFGASEKFEPLADSTQKARENRWGYYKQGNVGDGTLLWTGRQRGEIEAAEEGDFVGVGSPDPIMFYQELGTARIPPRPLFKIAAQAITPEGSEVIRIVAGKMLGKGI